MSELLLKVEPVFESNITKYRVYGYLHEIDLPVTMVAKCLEFEKAREGSCNEAITELSYTDAVFLMDQLYTCGIRPSKEIDVDKDIDDEVSNKVGFLKELLRRQDIHLGDVRDMLNLRKELIDE